jgi:polysaccharide chain length determinant protein (PEP-CTERM system associated)
MDELLRKAQIILRGCWHYRKLGLITAWLVGAAGVVVIMLLPERYEAKARIYVNTASILKPLMQGLTVPTNDDTRISMLSRVLITRPNVEKLVQVVGLDATAKTKDEYEKLIDRVTKSLEIKVAGRDNVYNLSFRDKDPEIAKNAVGTLASMFIESGQGGKVGETDAAKKFIDEQIVIYDKKLQEAESRLKEFKLKYLGLSPGEGAGYFARLSEASAQLSRAQLELREAENQRDAFRRGLAAEDTSSSTPGQPAAVPSSVVADLDARLDAQRRNLDSLLQRFTESHPDVLGATRVIKELEEQRRAAIASRPRDTTVSVAAVSTPRAIDQLKVSLAGAEAQVASLRSRVAEFTARHNQLRAAATQMPQLESEYAQLNRDYEVIKRNYETLVSKRESASISGEMQSVSGVADFRVIDPPRASAGPVAPNRRLMYPLTFLVAIAAGIAAAFAAWEMRPTFYDRRTLGEVTGLPILGSVSAVMNPSARMHARKQTLGFIFALGAFVAAYAAGFIALVLFSKPPAV